jgi:hypothetical protein
MSDRKAPMRLDRPFHLNKVEYSEHSIERGLSEGVITQDASGKEWLPSYLNRLRWRINKITPVFSTNTIPVNIHIMAEL